MKALARWKNPYVVDDMYHLMWTGAKWVWYPKYLGIAPLFKILTLGQFKFVILAKVF